MFLGFSEVSEEIHRHELIRITLVEEQQATLASRAQLKIQACQAETIPGPAEAQLPDVQHVQQQEAFGGAKETHGEAKEAYSSSSSTYGKNDP